MERKPERLAQPLAAEPRRPADLVAGPDPLLVLAAADAVRAGARALGIAEREVFDAAGAREPDWDALSASFRAPSLFTSRRLIELRLPTGKPGKEGAEVIADFCADPPSDVTLLVTAGEWSKKHGGKWSEAMARIGHAVTVWAVKPHEQVDWIDRRLRAKGLRADREAVQNLARRVEGNLLAAAQEIDKLVLLDHPGTLDAARMDALVADSARFDVFRLVDAAMNGQPAQVSRMLRGLRAEGEAVPALLGMIVKELQSAAGVARAQGRGGDLGSAFRAMGVWESKQAMYRRALGRHATPARWERFVAEAGRVDRIAKGRAEGDEWLALERLLLAVADQKALGLLAS
jgi:DNA polymerase-3 subunit delta